ncbi:DoxX family protein [Novosphingobium sp. MMS21-SN21R]|uniref:DoxX family protein n=1 Tax=Novosphingobium sp. MMS21-SN21R TaxID=2969298 RepID=UPI0028866782|nr:DoxX family protein [Novosphingobium sp. MMS21-SN21R]MDT0507023.1 DoxX family protein [Novosphingobium sp. MMS21-SN21R]
MNDNVISGKGWTFILWVAQLLLAAAYALFGSMKATQPLDQLAMMMTWIPSFPPAFVRTLGVVEVLGAIGLVVPALTRVLPRLTVIAALCILVHQLCAVALHVSKGEYNVLGLNIVLIALAALIVWGRGTKAIILPRS